MRKPLLVASLLSALVSVSALPLAAQAAKHKVMAFYYTWYGTPEFQDGRWQHWNECRGCTHDPSRKIDIASPRTGEKLAVPDTGTKDHPLALYDSNDPAVIREHLKMAERAGIDAFIATWWGRGLYHDRALRKALDAAQAANSAVRFTIYYETVPRTSADPVQAIIDDFRYLRTEYASHPCFLREGGSPVFFIYGRAMGQLKPDQWIQALAGIRALGPAVLIADGLNPAWLDLFDGLHEYNPVGQIVKKTDMTARYRTTAENCRAKGKISAATIIPGYDDSNIGRERTIVADRENGELYRRLWQNAIGAKPDWVLITSFNEWHEGSEIEPSVEWGEMFLDLTREFSTKFKK